MAAPMPTGSLTPQGRAGSGQSGFTYLYVLMLIALIGMGLAAAGSLWHTDAQRARESELLFIGDQYRKAIRSFYELDPGQPRLPQSVDELLEDRRRPDIVRHMRRAYRDPITGEEFALIRTPDTQGITGVFSRSSARPIKTAGFLPEDEAFSQAASYADWQFVFRPPAVPVTPSASAPANQPVPSRPSIGVPAR